MFIVDSLTNDSLSNLGPLDGLSVLSRRVLERFCLKMKLVTCLNSRWWTIPLLVCLKTW